MHPDAPYFGNYTRAIYLKNQILLLIKPHTVRSRHALQEQSVRYREVRGLIDKMQEDRRPSDGISNSALADYRDNPQQPFAELGRIFNCGQSHVVTKYWLKIEIDPRLMGGAIGEDVS